MDLAAPKGPLSIALVGAGAVGTYYGGRLAVAVENESDARAHLGRLEQLVAKNGLK